MNTLKTIRQTDAAAAIEISGIFDRARELEDSGEYEQAAASLGKWWKGVGTRPKVDSLPPLEKAQVLSRVGSISSWLGSKRQIARAQEAAKDLISEAVDLFDRLEDTENWAETRSDLAVCYWRAGEFDEARAFLTDTLASGKILSSAVRGKILLRQANVEISTSRYSDALATVNEATSLVEKFGDNLLLGKLYFHRALILRRLAKDQENPGLLNSAIDDYKQAAEFYLQAGHMQFLANVENNLGYLHFTMKKYPEAHRHFDAALEILTHQQDMGIAAPVYDNKAQTFLAEGKLEEAENAARTSVLLLKGGGEKSSLAESFTTLGAVFGMRENPVQANQAFAEAKEAALSVGDRERAGNAVLTQLEIMYKMMNPTDFKALLTESDGYLRDSPQLATFRRIQEISVTAVSYYLDNSALKKARTGGWEDFSLPESVRKYEGEIILSALTESSGRVTKAAKMLGLSHQNLSLILHQRHRELKKHCVQRKPRTVKKKKSN